jgi:hypothetical protein
VSDGPSISEYLAEYWRMAKRAANEAQWEGRLAGVVELPRYAGRTMAGKKSYDATKKLPEGEPTQVLPGGTKVGLPTRESIFEALRKVARKPEK